MRSEPLLATAPSGDVLELRPAGSWIAANVAKLEALAQSVKTDIDRSGGVRLDMAGVSELDTLGAWLLEKLSRRVASAESPAQIIGVADKFSGLMEEVREVNRHNPAPQPAPNAAVSRLATPSKMPCNRPRQLVIRSRDKNRNAAAAAA